MDKNTNTLLNKFNYCGKVMVLVIMKGKAACIMPEKDYNRIVEAERKYRKRNAGKVM